MNNYLAIEIDPSTVGDPLVWWKNKTLSTVSSENISVSQPSLFHRNVHLVLLDT